MPKKIERDYPDHTLEEELNKRTIPWICLWEIKATKHCNFAWLVGYLINGHRIVIVQTYRQRRGWQAFIASAKANVSATVDEVLDASNA